MERTRQGSEYWALPACNFTGNLELTLGAARAFGLHEGRETKLIVQGKTIYRELEPNGWGLGLVAGAESPVLAAGRRVLGDLYAHVPVSASLREGRTLLHANLGWAYDRPERRHNFIWGAAGETQVLSRTWLLAESFGQQTGRPFYQVGMRHWIVPDRLQIDATYGNRFGRGSEERRFSIGLAIFTAPFLP